MEISLDDEEDIEVTEDILSFHSNVRENIVSEIFVKRIWIKEFGSIDCEEFPRFSVLVCACNKNNF